MLFTCFYISYGMSMTTLEEVFLRLGELAETAQTGEEGLRESSVRAKNEPQQEQAHQEEEDQEQEQGQLWEMNDPKSFTVYFDGVPRSAPRPTMPFSTDDDDASTTSMVSSEGADAKEEGRSRAGSRARVKAVLE